jgi:hypothetical protein
MSFTLLELYQSGYVLQNPHKYVLLNKEVFNLEATQDLRNFIIYVKAVSFLISQLFYLYRK